MASSSETPQISDVEMEAAIDQFTGVTGATEDMARNTLEACNWNIELAINMFVDANESSVDIIESAKQINSSNTNARQTNDEVRAPIPPVRQVLVDDYPSASFSNHIRRPNQSVFDAFRDFEAEARWQEQMLREPGSAVSSNSKRRTLEDLFRPPLDLICRGTLEFAKDEGQRLNKWLLVNIQNHQEFSCQVLNRDVWSNPAVKSIIAAHFVFWQVYHDTVEGQRFMQFYNVVDFPYVAILDPRTGEKIRFWTTIDSVTFCELITDFLHEHPSPSGSDTIKPESNLKSNSSVDKVWESLYDESEEMQLKAAIAASLEDTVKHEQNANMSFGNEADDSDELETFDSDNEDVNASISNNPSKKAVIQSESKILNTKVSPVSSTSVPNTSLQNISPSPSPEDWRQFLGPENGNKFEFVVRLPDGKRENIIFPSHSQLKALFLYLSSKGFNMNEYDLITNFPKRNLKDATNGCESITLESAGIHSRDILYVQHKT